MVARRGALLALVWLLASSCAELIGLDDYAAARGSEGGAGPGGGAQSTGTAGGGAGTTQEDCVDLLDNDEDGDIDCADADCVGYDCLPSAPAGWAGPVTLAIGAPETLPSCSDAPPQFEGGEGAPTIPAPACPCTCDVPSLSCQASFGFASEVQCDTTILVFGSGCVPANGLNSFVQASISSNGNASCAVTSSDPLPGAVTWPNMVRGCVADVGGGCRGAVCVAVPEGFDRLCIYQSGQAMCPGGEYTEQLLVERYDPNLDMRGCDQPCTCTPMNIACGGQLSVFAQVGCMGMTSMIMPDVCFPAAFEIQSALYMPTVEGTCQAGARTPVTDITFDTTTVCCKPR